MRHVNGIASSPRSAFQAISNFTQQPPDGLQLAPLNLQNSVVNATAGATTILELLQQMVEIGFIGRQTPNQCHAFATLSFFNRQASGLFLGRHRRCRVFRKTIAFRFQFTADVADRRPVKRSTFKESHARGFLICSFAA